MNLYIRIISIFAALMITFQPVLPYIEYFAFKSYISKNLCINRNKPCCSCHGKCFLKKRLQESNSTSDQKTPVHFSLKAFDGNLPGIIYQFNIMVDDISLYSIYIAFYRFNYIIDFFHPPQITRV